MIKLTVKCERKQTLVVETAKDALLSDVLESYCSNQNIVLGAHLEVDGGPINPGDTAEHCQLGNGDVVWVVPTWQMLQGHDLVEAVLRAPNRYALLSLGSAVPIAVGTDGFLNLQDEEIRKVYMKMSVQLHPDRLRDFPDATRAFQALVRAYELCCKPDLRADDSEDSRSGGEDSSDDEAAGGSDGEAEAEDEDEDDEAPVPFPAPVPAAAPGPGPAPAPAAAAAAALAPALAPALA